MISFTSFSIAGDSQVISKGILFHRQAWLGLLVDVRFSRIRRESLPHWHRLPGKGKLAYYTYIYSRGKTRGDNSCHELLLSQIGHLQMAIADAARKSIIFLDEGNSTLPDYQTLLAGIVDKRHHPVQILRPRHGHPDDVVNDEIVVEQIVVCHRDSHQIPAGLFRKGVWSNDPVMNTDALEAWVRC